MAGNLHIRDGATKSMAKVGSNNQLYTTIVEPDLPNLGTENRYRFYSEYLSNSAGVTNANVDGSVTRQYFNITSSNDYDIHIMRIVMFVQDGSVTHAGFGALVSLTNGVNLYTVEGGEKIFVLKNVQNFADAIEQTAMEAPFGSGTTAFELDGVSGTEDAWVLPFSIGELIPGGLRIGRGTKDKLELEVADNLTGLTIFTMRVMGYIHVP